MRLSFIACVVVLVLLVPASGMAVLTAQCPPTPNTPASGDVTRGRCLFHSPSAFGQDKNGPYAACASCHYGSNKSDQGVHLIQITNGAGRTVQLLRKTPTLLKAAENFPYGADGRFTSVQDAAHAAIVSPVEMRGTSVTQDQLDALAAFVLALPGSDPDSAHFQQPPAPDAGTLNLIAIGKQTFFGAGTCFTCHGGPEFTNHTVTTDQVNLTFTGSTDPGGGFVGTGAPATFKVPSLLYLGADRPLMHNGAIATLTQLLTFYNESLNLHLTGSQMNGLQYWLQNCLDPRRNPKPSTC